MTALEAAIEIAKDYENCGSNRMATLAEAVIRLTEERDKAVEVIKFYAKDLLWKPSDGIDNLDSKLALVEEFKKDNGKKAREFLEGIK